MVSVHGGPLLVDEDGFVAIIDAKTYRGFVDEDWTLEQLAEHLARERAAERAVIVYPGPDLADAPVALAEQSPTVVTRSYSHPITVTDGRLHLTDYTTLTMAAQFDDESPIGEHTPWLELPNGRHLVTVATSEDGVTVTIAPIDDAASATREQPADLIPWLRL